jgi:anoctamin-10/anoctamin-7
MLGCFALHDYEKLYEVSTQWLPFSVLPWDQPFDLMREYFGEKIALYFVFMGHYTYWLMAPAFIGFVLQIAIWYYSLLLTYLLTYSLTYLLTHLLTYLLTHLLTYSLTHSLTYLRTHLYRAMNDYSAPFLPFYALFMAMWSVFMLEFWKRKEKDFAIRWGTLNFEESEKDCSEFKGQSIKSFIQNGKMRYYPTSTRCINMSQSTVVVVALIAAVVGAVAGIYLMRKSLEHAVGSAAQSITSVVNVVQIQVMNFTYNFIVTELTNRENHRTETDYEDSMITKLFVFQFVNSYASFFYLAFFAQYFGAECGDDGCMTVLALNLAIVYGSRLVTGNLTELFIPYLSYKYRYNKEILTSSAEMSRPEKEFYLDTYDSRKSSLVDYAEVAIQFGYNALFATALPISSFFSLASNFVEIKGDAWKLVNIFQRPVPVAAEDIGSWQTIFLLLTVASVITNGVCIVITMIHLA